MPNTSCPDCIPSSPPPTSLTLCRTAYNEVSECMKLNKDQVRECQKEWRTFKECHDREPRKEEEKIGWKFWKS